MKELYRKLKKGFDDIEAGRTRPFEEAIGDIRKQRKLLIEQYDKVQLKTGEIAWIVEIFDNGKAYLADIDRKDDTETEWLYPSEIEKVLK